MCESKPCLCVWKEPSYPVGRSSYLRAPAAATPSIFPATRPTYTLSLYYPNIRLFLLLLQRRVVRHVAALRRRVTAATVHASMHDVRPRQRHSATAQQSQETKRPHSACGLGLELGPGSSGVFAA
eukprot:scaffold18144_cov130-Isochrysis_galbana.AAC.2